MIKCTRCGVVIKLAKTGPVYFKWVTNPDKPKESWKCQPDRDFPMRSHNPDTQDERVIAANRAS